MLKELQALAERGVDGEKLVARRKIDPGKQIRFSVPLQEITAELARATQQSLTKDAGAPDCQGTGETAERARLSQPSGAA